MCIGHGIRVAARSFVTFVKGRLNSEMLVIIIIIFVFAFLPSLSIPEGGLKLTKIN